MKNLSSTQHIMGANIEPLILHNSNKTLTPFMNSDNYLDINEIFPMETEEKLDQFECKHKNNKNYFKTILVRYIKINIIYY